MKRTNEKRSTYSFVSSSLNLRSSFVTASLITEVHFEIAAASSRITCFAVAGARTSSTPLDFASLLVTRPGPPGVAWAVGGGSVLGGTVLDSPSPKKAKRTRAASRMPSTHVVNRRTCAAHVVRKRDREKLLRKTILLVVPVDQKRVQSFVCCIVDDR